MALNPFMSFKANTAEIFSAYYLYLYIQLTKKAVTMSQPFLLISHQYQSSHFT